jgi:hypothetical protein
MSTTPTPPVVSPADTVSQSAPPQMPQAPPPQPTYDPSDEVRTDQGESWSAAPSGHSDFLQRILHAVGDAIAPPTKQGVNAQGQLVNVPQTTAQRVTGALQRGIAGAAAGAAQQGPGAVGKALLAGVQSTQNQQKIDEEQLMNRSTIALRNNTWLMDQKNFDLRSQEFQRQILDSDNAIADHMGQAQASTPVIPGANGKDLNGSSDEQGLMQWRMTHPAPQGSHYVPITEMGGDGKKTYTIYQVPENTLDTLKTYSPEESQSMGLGRQTTHMTLKDALAMQQMHNQQTGTQESAKRYQDLVTGPFHLPEDQVAAQDQLTDDAAAYRFFKANPQFVTPETYATLHDRVQQVQDAFPKLTATPLATQKTQAEINQSKAATAKDWADAAKAKSETGLKAEASVYAYDPTSDTTVLTNMANARANNMQAVRPVKESDIRNDLHDTRVLNDVAAKANAVTDAAPVLDSLSTMQKEDLASVLTSTEKDANLEIGAFGTKLPTASWNAFMNSSQLHDLPPAAQTYAIAVLQLREAGMGLQKVLTGSARSNEQQIQALQATMPGLEQSAAIAQQKMAGFTQNIDMLRKGIPVMPGMKVIPIKAGQALPQKTPPPAAQGSYNPDTKAIEWNPM